MAAMVPALLLLLPVLLTSSSPATSAIATTGDAAALVQTTRTTALSIFMFYGLNETAQCGWTTHGWQELGTDQSFKKNLSVALADVVSFHAHCHAGGFVMVPPAVWTPLRHGATDWGLQLDAFESTQWLRHCFGPSPTAFPSSIPPRGCRVA